MAVLKRFRLKRENVAFNEEQIHKMPMAVSKVNYVRLNYVEFVEADDRTLTVRVHNEKDNGWHAILVRMLWRHVGMENVYEEDEQLFHDNPETWEEKVLSFEGTIR